VLKSTMHLDIKSILSNPTEFDKSMKNRGENIISDQIVHPYRIWQSSNLELEQISAKLNALSKSFDKDNIKQCTELGERKKLLEVKVKELRSQLDYELDRLPNLLDTEVPVGKNSDDNVVLEYRNDKPNISMPRHHEDIAVDLGMWAREEAIAMSGSRFICLRGDLAKLERTLIRFALDINTKAGYKEVSVPFLVKRHSMYNTGQLPKFEEDYFAFSDYALISTGEIPLVNLYTGKTLQHSELPIKLTTHTPCFRSEAGSLGKDTKGLIRLHQFHKIELVTITDQENSSAMHLEMLEHVKKILDMLKLHYRVVEVCSGDIGFTAARQFDIEAWMPGQNKYVEVASCSNCRDFQARRMKTKYSLAGNLHYVHTLNSTSIACGRIIAAILENYCFMGEFVLPDILYGYWDN